MTVRPPDDVLKYDDIDYVPLPYLPMVLKGSAMPPGSVDEVDAEYSWAAGSKRSAILRTARDSQVQPALRIGGFKNTSPAVHLRIEDTCQNDDELKHLGSQPVWTDGWTGEPVESVEDLCSVAFNGKVPYCAPKTRKAKKEGRPGRGDYVQCWAAKKEVFARLVHRLKEHKGRALRRVGEKLEKIVDRAEDGKMVIVSYVGLTFKSFDQRLSDILARMKGEVLQMLEEEAKNR